MKKILLTVVILVVLVGIAVFTAEKNQIKTSNQGQTYPEGTSSAKAYFEENLAVISPAKPVLGGTFYVTNIEIRDGEGTVYYEDGHNAYIGDFYYTIDEQGVMSIESFVFRK